jgi:hypothetical protein
MGKRTVSGETEALSHQEPLFPWDGIFLGNRTKENLKLNTVELSIGIIGLSLFFLTGSRHMFSLRDFAGDDPPKTAPTSNYFHGMFR